MVSSVEIIGKSEAILNLLDVAGRVADTEATVLIQGESGTGKELLARFIQEHSKRKDKRFIAINCAAIPTNLLENELFGHKAGAFTDAKSDYIGKFGYANYGTVFLDEIGEMDMALQAKLLRVLQYKEYEQVGNPEPIKVDIRLIAATNKNLYNLVKENRFREDLYYRLNVVPLNIPPLRDRVEDIEVLTYHFLKIYNNKNSKNIKGFTLDAVNFLKNHPWHGNVRELQNLIERAVILSKNEFIDLNELNIENQNPNVSKTNDVIKPLKDAINDFKKDYVTYALSKNGWNQTHTAKKLEIQRTYLTRLVKELNIDKI
ncbi:MAG TPA: sigma-54 dependent transcriptional regulator [Spirochaetota bacterium]|nr:sigma-54 dependent transcriptional regulator [Spirochaetota bacterium]